MSFINRIKDWRRRRILRERLDEELSFHLDELTAEYQRRGDTVAVARLKARRDLGNETLVQESHRDQAGLPWLEEWGRDVLLAWRNLSRRRGYALSMICLLAVGLGATLSVYVLTDAMLRRALPVPQPTSRARVASAPGRTFRRRAST